MNKKKDNKERNKKIYKCYLIATIYYFIAAIINLALTNIKIGIMEIFLTILFFILMLIYLKKYKKENK